MLFSSLFAQSTTYCTTRHYSALKLIAETSPKTKNIPKWDISNIPTWDSKVKGGFPVRLKELRLARGITQVRMAIDLNMSQNTISRYETGEREPALAELVRLADYFGVSVDYLLERTDKPEINR